MAASFEESPQRYVRIGGLLYLTIFALGLFGESFVRGTLVVPGNPAATATAIAQAPQLWRAGIVGDLLMHVLDLPVIALLYLLLKPVSRKLALLATLFNLIQTAVLVANKLNLLIPLFLLDNTPYLSAFSTAQLQALAQLAIRLHGYGFGIGLIFFGIACVIRGVLLWRCGFLPRSIGLLIVLAGASYLINSVALLAAPELADAMFPAILVPAFFGELALCLWLLIKGIDLPRWRTGLQGG